MTLAATNRWAGPITPAQVLSINFAGGYLDRAHVKAYSYDPSTGELTPLAFSFVGDYSITGMSVNAGLDLIVRRETPDTPLVDFVSGARLSEYNLDTSNQQSLFRATEAADLTEFIQDYYLSLNPAGLGTNLTALSSADAALGARLTKLEYPRIAVIADSLAATFPLLSETWPTLLEAQLAAYGAPVSVFNCATGGHSFYRANTVITHGTMTMVQKAISTNPDVVIVQLGLNDTITKAAGLPAGTPSSGIDSRSLAQSKADALSLFTTLRAALPNAVLLYASEKPYDASNFNPASAMTNEAACPIFVEAPTTGLVANCFSKEGLAAPLMNQPYQNWVSLDSYIKGLSQVNGSFTLDVWRTMRLGGHGQDGLHLNQMGHRLFCGYAVKGLLASAAFKALLPATLNVSAAPAWADPDELFVGLLEQTGGRWVTRSTYPKYFEEIVQQHWGNMRAFNPDTWYLPSCAVMTPPTDYVAQDPDVQYVLRISGAMANYQVEQSINGGSFGSSGLVTDSNGEAQLSFNGDSVPVGTNTYRYKVFNEIYGPFTVNGIAKTSSKFPVTLTPLSSAGVITGTEEFAVLRTGTVLRTALSSVLTWITSAARSWSGRQTATDPVAGVGFMSTQAGSGSSFVNANNSTGGLSMGMLAGTGPYIGSSVLAQGLTIGADVLRVNGYTKLGVSAPAISMQKIVMTGPGASGGITSVAHGLNHAKIISCMAKLQVPSSNTYVCPGYKTATGYEFYWTLDATNVNITIPSGGGGANIGNATVTIVLLIEQ